jgi:iron complex outermembrane receptor protein
MAVTRCALAAMLGGLMFAAPLAAQNGTGTVSGRVLDSASRQPLAAVSVRINGTTLGALSRTDGSYTIAGVRAGPAQVRATRIGFAAQIRDVTVPNGASVTADFALNAQAAVLSEMVVTGYGAQKRESITGSVSTVDAEQANVGVITNANQMLQGRVAGLAMTTNNGEPGSGAQIRIRGGTSISASNDPLYVIDGVPLQNTSAVAGAYDVGVSPALGRSPLNTINPSDIESITVLKDASATAIYGSRGANGVILIQTRRGMSRRASVDYDTYVAASAPAKSLKLLTGDEYRAFVQAQVAKGNLPQSQLAGLGTANTDWEDALTRNGYANNHNLSFAGGSEATTYRASLNYFDQKGVVEGNGLTRYQGRLNAQHQALDGKLGLGLTLTASRVNNQYIALENGGGFTGGVFTNMAIYNPTRPVIDPATGKYFEIGTGAQGVRNPVALVNQIQDGAPENRVLGNLTGSLQLHPTLVAQTTVGADYSNAVRQTYFPIVNPIGAAYNGLARQAERSIQNLNFQQLLTWTPALTNTQSLDLVGGYEYSDFDNHGFEVVSQGFITDVFTFNHLGGGTQAGSPAPISYVQESQLASFFARANYGIADKYFLTGVMRRDGSSRLAEGHKWSTFPALSASWRISNEDFMRGSRFSTLALRAGWGRQGNQAVQPYATQLLLRADNGAKYPFGSSITTGLAAGQVANPDLRWETAEQTNFGIDWGVKSDRFTGIIDIYQKTTKDLLLTVPVPQPAVVDSRIENIGSVRNRGVEATLEARLIESGNKTLSSGLILSVERNSVQSLGEGREFIITGGVFGQGQSGRFGQRLIPGQPLGTFWGPKFLRVDGAGKQVFSCVTGSVGCTNGETFSPTGADEGIIGNANPAFSLGFHSNFTAGKFDASWNWRGEFGREVFNNTALVYSTKGNAKQDRNFLASALDDPTGISEPSIYSSRWIENGRFIRLQNATVGYAFTLPTRMGGGRTVRAYLSGDNLLLFTPYTGYDPEVFVSSGVASRGIDYLTYPRARTYTVGARIQL